MSRTVRSCLNAWAAASRVPCTRITRTCSRRVPTIQNKYNKEEPGNSLLSGAVSTLEMESRRPARVSQAAFFLAIASHSLSILSIAAASRASILTYALDRPIPQHSVESIGRKNILLDQPLALAPAQLGIESPEETPSVQFPYGQHSVESIGRANIFPLQLPAGLASAVASELSPSQGPASWTDERGGQGCGSVAGRFVTKDPLLNNASAQYSGICTIPVPVCNR